MAQQFIFENFLFNEKSKTLKLKYSFDNKIFFTEEFIFEFEFAKNFSHKALDRVLFGLWIMCGISYFKAELPPEIIFRQHKISKEQKKFFEKIYYNGLGEFFYQNKINPEKKINFTYDENHSPTPLPLKNLQGSLVPLGGGKDSLVTVELLKKAKKNFDLWHVGDDTIFVDLVKKIDVPLRNIKRKICPNLIALNKKGALNGHVPISAILAFLSIVSAILLGKKNIILSNEHSANEPTTEFFGKKINHQYSKTLEFEKNFQNYVKNFISPDINYFSFLRPFSELKIAKIFCEKNKKGISFFDKYFYDFSSCNKNFTQKNSSARASVPNYNKKFFWCCECPKCAFVFLIFAPFVKRKKLISLFGKNLFLEKNLEEFFWELLGLRKKKPFECVGSILDVRQAFFLAEENFPEVKKFTEKISKPKLELDKFYENEMPKYFEDIIFSNSK